MGLAQHQQLRFGHKSENLAHGKADLFDETAQIDPDAYPPDSPDEREAGQTFILSQTASIQPSNPTTSGLNERPASIVGGRFLAQRAFNTFQLG